MSKNLLTNGGFEMDWSMDKSHRCLIFPVDGEPYETDVGNIFTPSGGWMTWFRHDAGTWDQPEVRDAWVSGDPRRVHSGLKATLLFTFYRKHDAGFFQQVEVETGTELRFTAWAHAWSNSKGEGFPHPSDPRWSEGAGYDVVAWTPEEIPPLSGEPQNDAKGNFRFCIGIDPTGGTNPLAATVVWGGAKHIYNGYAQLSVEAVADSGMITVFLRSRTLYGFRHNDGYWDDVVLESADDEPPPYESTMLVLPQDATPEQLSEILGLAYPGKRTFGFSHDDAGNLNGTAILYNIPASEKNAYLGFYVTRYPDVTVKFAYTSDWVEPPSGLLLKQCDPRWKDEKIAGPDCDLTLCQTGCWISDCAMVQKFFNIKPDATPHTANQALGAVGGFDGCYTRWSSMKEALGLEVFEKHYDDQRARDWIDGGYVCFAEVEPGDAQHFVLVTKYSEGRFWMHDPYKGVEGWLDEYYPEIESWRSVCPFESTPPVSGSLVSLHLQSLVEGALDFVARVKPQVVKIFQLEVAKEIKARSPDTIVVLRYFTGDQDLSGDIRASMRDYVRSFQPSLETNHGWIDLVEGWNEIVCSNNADSIKRAVESDYWFAEELMALELPGIAPQLLNVAVGNPLESEVELLLPAVEQAIKYGGTLGYHCFSADTEVLTEGGWSLLSEIVEETLPIRLATLNQATGKVEYQLPTDYFVYDHVGPMVHVGGKVDVLVTPNHRMWIRSNHEERQHRDDLHQGFEFVEAGNLPPSFETRRDLGQYQGIKKEIFDLPAYSKEWVWGSQPFKIYRPTLAIPMDAWLAFFGFWITEGHVSKNAVGFTQNPGETLDLIIEAIEGCGFEYSVYGHKNRTTKQVGILRPAQLESYLRQFGKAKDKFIPRWMLSLSQQQLRILFDAMMAGDGSWGHSPYFCTASPQLADDFQELALKVGYATTLSQHCDGYFYVGLVAERKTPRTRPPHINTVKYEGKIYCVSVPNGLVFMRRNGKPSWQGNSYGYAPNKGNLNDAWQYYAGRALEGWDPVFRDHGLYPMYVFGECGAFATCNDGWRAANCLGGDWVLYLAQLIEFSDRIKAWNARHSNRCLGGTLFTSGTGCGWDSFQIRAEEMRDPSWPL